MKEIAPLELGMYNDPVTRNGVQRMFRAKMADSPYGEQMIAPHALVPHRIPKGVHLVPPNAARVHSLWVRYGDRGSVNAGRKIIRPAELRLNIMP